MAEHKNITDPELHEPKGVSTATAGMVYLADGAGSGTWTTLSTLFPTKIHASMYFNTDQTITLGTNTFAQTTGWSAGAAEGITVSTNSFTIVTAGDYDFFATLSCRKATGTGVDDVVFVIDIAKNDTAVQRQMSLNASSETDLKNVSLMAHLHGLQANDVITIVVKNSTNDDDVTFASGVAMLQRVI